MRNVNTFPPILSMKIVLLFYVVYTQLCTLSEYCYVAGYDTSIFRRIAPAPPPARKKNAAIPVAAFSKMRYLDLMYSSIALAAFLPAPIARMTVAAPVTASPPA